MNHVFKMIIIIIIIKWKKKSKGGREGVGRRALEREKYFIFFLFVSFLDLRKSDRRFSSRLKAKLIHAMRATRGHKNIGVSSNSTR